MGLLYPTFFNKGIILLIILNKGKEKNGDYCERTEGI
jgi:hypothetical protein